MVVNCSPASCCGARCSRRLIGRSVPPDRQIERPFGRNGWMIVRVGMAPRESSLGFAEFQAHWANEHGTLAATLAGLRSYVQNHAVLAGGRPLLPYPGFDACSELTFDSLEAMDEAFESDHYRQNVTADEKELIDRSRFSMMLTERRVLTAGDPGCEAV